MTVNLILQRICHFGGCCVNNFNRVTGILSHICSDGPDKWQVGDDELSYDTVLKVVNIAREIFYP